MNFLAHLYLSGDDDEVMIGNFIADKVRRYQRERYTAGVQAGILLHHFIDAFTDSHPVVQQSKQRLYDKYHKYAAVIVDVFYDHFLAANWSRFSPVGLDEFTGRAYTLLQSHLHTFPPNVQFFVPYMVERDWLGNYARIEGAGRALAGLSGKARLANRMSEAVEDLRNDYGLYEEEFHLFFPELVKQSEQQLLSIKAL